MVKTSYPRVFVPTYNHNIGFGVWFLRLPFYLPFEEEDKAEQECTEVDSTEQMSPTDSPISLMYFRSADMLFQWFTYLFILPKNFSNYLKS